ncbi:hypothetical protein HUG10_08040 [Halorarum halophilum]|uniref:Uncharacterized protein n=1 Tax=Halorarum halophilum TaxID=2743090 RepID=A0A7D5GKI5_9EURY|nr:hypothetical protein [Halobaculum halophilum]QLG27504.1 hypothetical protein HUG10_08040 [Halobaculum halophilum]
MATESVSSDMGTGLAIVFGAVATVGVGFMLAGGSQQVMAWGFALAMLAGALSVSAVHLYDA